MPHPSSFCFMKAVIVPGGQKEWDKNLLSLLTKVQS